jgi:hypothetical protein
MEEYMSFKETSLMKVVCILVKMDLRDKLAENIDLQKAS